VASPRPTLDADIALALRDEQAQRMLMRLAQHYGVLESVHTPGDPYSTAYRDGQRCVVLHLMDACALADMAPMQKIMEDTARARLTSDPDFPAVPDIDTLD
jgi:hypothetical protein